MKMMKTKRILTFIAIALLPMIAIGVFLHYMGSDTSANAPTASIITYILSAGAMMLPLIATVITQLIFKEPVLRDLGISFKINRWWLFGWLIFPLISLAVLGISLLMPGAYLATDSETVKLALQQMPQGSGIWGLVAITLVSGLISGITINAFFAFGEEIAWRGFLIEELKGMHFIPASILIGTIWGFWHFPLILNGHNYPDHPVVGVFMMVLVCIAMTPMLMYFRRKSESVIVPAIMHGTFNAVIGLSNILVAPQNDLLIGGPGLSGIIVFLLADLLLFLYDRYISAERIFTSTI